MNRVAADAREFHRRRRQAVGERVTVDRADHHRIERRIVVAIGLALGVGRDRRHSRVDRQRGVDLGHRVVRVRPERHRDRVAADAREFHRRRRQAVGERVAVDRAGHHRIERRIVVAVGLALGVGRDRRHRRVDRQRGVALVTV